MAWLELRRALNAKALWRGVVDAAGRTLRDRRKLLQLAACIAAASLLLVMYGPTLLAHMRNSADPNIANDDALQQVFPFFRYSDSRLFHGDYIGDYYLANLPLGYRLIYTAAALVNGAIALSKVLPYLLFTAVLVAVGLSARRVAGGVAVFFVLALCLGNENYMHRMGGGLPRAFAFAFMAWALYALVSGRVKLLAGLVPLAAAFYPASTPPIGLALFVLLVLVPREHRGEAQAWSLKRRFAVLAIAASAAALLLVPPVLSAARFGAVITPADTEEYPEVGPGGRYNRRDRAPFPGFFESIGEVAADGIKGTGAPWSQAARDFLNTPSPRISRAQVLNEVLCLLTLLGWWRLLQSQSAARRVVALVIGVFIGHVLARAAAPYLYLPQRYLIFPIPLLSAFFVATGVTTLVQAIKWKSPWFGRTAAAAVALTVLAFIGGRGNPLQGLKGNPGPSHPLVRAVAELPPDAMIAGFPRRMIDYIPYGAQRRVLLGWETHQAFHRGYADEMRRRMRAIIDVYFATDEQPLLRLKREFGVSHLVVHRNDLRGHLKYFRPFNADIQAAKERAKGKSLVLAGLVNRAAILRSDGFTLVDLSRLPTPTEHSGRQL